MIKTTGKSNIPLFVGFVGANQVLNTHDETNSLQLRITNTNLPNPNLPGTPDPDTPDPNDPDITFHYDGDPSKCSQLVVVLEVGTVADVPWALGIEDQVKAITISLDSTKWEQKVPVEQITVEGIVKALQWTFAPKSFDVVLAVQETMLIDFSNIKTAHPTGATNLYLRYQYIEGYKDGQFTCQIEKAPLVLDSKVRIGTRTEREGLLTVKDGISLDYPGEIQHTGPLVFRSDVDNSNDGSSVQFFKGTTDVTPLMELKSDGNLNFGSRNGQHLNLFSTGYGIGIQSNTIYFRSSSNFAWHKGGSHNEDSLTPGDGGTLQMVINANGDVGIGTASPSAKLDVSGKIKGSELEVTGNTTIPNGNLSFGEQEGHLLNLYKTDFAIGIQPNTFYFRTYGNFAWYKGGVHDSGLLAPGSGGTVQMAIKDGNVGIGTNDPQGKLDVHGGKIRINGGPVIKYEIITGGWSEYSTSEWFAAVIGFSVKSDAKHEWSGFYVYPSEQSGKWYFYSGIGADVDSDAAHPIKSVQCHVLFIRKELFD